MAPSVDTLAGNRPSEGHAWGLQEITGAYPSHHLGALLAFGGIICERLHEGNKLPTLPNANLSPPTLLLELTQDCPYGTSSGEPSLTPSSAKVSLLCAP